MRAVAWILDELPTMTLMFDRIRRLLRQGIRALVRRPISSAASIACLGFGVAACATAWILVSDTLLRPFGLDDADRLVVVWETDPAHGRPLIEVSLPNFFDWQRESRTIESMAAFGSSHWPALARIGSDTIPLAARGVSASFFATLGVRPALGRDFAASDGSGDAVPPIVLSDRIWRSRFGADPGIVGRRLFVDGSDAQIIGVMPAGFGFPDDPDAWISAERVLLEAFKAMPPEAQRQVGVLEVVARRRAGATNDQVRAELTTIIGGLRRRYQDPNDTVIAEVRPLPDVLIGALGARLWLALGLAAAVFLFAGANVAAVRLADARERSAELATRRALGASQTGLAAELALEAAVLTAVALPIGVAVAAMLTAAIASSPAVAESGLTPGGSALSLWSLVALLSLAGWLLSGVIPAALAARRTSALAVDAPGRVARGATRVGATLVLGEAAMAIVAVAIAATALQVFNRLSSTDVGFATRGVTMVDISVPDWKYATPADGRRLLADLQTALRSLPDVTHAAAVSIRPFRFGEVVDGLPVRREGEPLVQPDQATGASRVVVTPDYFDAIGQRLVEGRGFTSADRADGQPVVVISRTLARSLWGESSAIGKRLETYTLGEKWRQRLVVGVVGDARYRGLERPSMELYMPDTQSAAPLGSLVIAGGARTMLTGPILRRTLQRVEPDLALERVQTTADLVSTVLGPARLLATLMSVLGLAGLVLLAVGIFGAVATALRSAWPEIAVRQAVGAMPIQAARAPLKTLARSVLIGAAIGLSLTPLVLSAAAALGLSPGRTPTASMALAALAVTCAAVVATAPSLIRASRTSPAELLRAR